LYLIENIIFKKKIDTRILSLQNYEKFKNSQKITVYTEGKIVFDLLNVVIAIQDLNKTNRNFLKQLQYQYPNVQLTNHQKLLNYIKLINIGDFIILVSKNNYGYYKEFNYLNINNKNSRLINIFFNTLFTIIPIKFWIKKLKIISKKTYNIQTILDFLQQYNIGLQKQETFKTLKLSISELIQIVKTTQHSEFYKLYNEDLIDSQLMLVGLFKTNVSSQCMENSKIYKTIKSFRVLTKQQLLLVKIMLGIANPIEQQAFEKIKFELLNSSVVINSLNSNYFINVNLSCYIYCVIVFLVEITLIVFFTRTTIILYTILKLTIYYKKSLLQIIKYILLFCVIFFIIRLVIQIII
jgi:hypothetical protein